MTLARFALSLLALAFVPTAASAQGAAPVTPPTLAAALAAVTPPKDEVVLVVAAETTRLPVGAAPPAEGASLNGTAAAFGRITQDFGSVTAVAPPTMTLLNAAPGTPNIYADLRAGDALKLLAATLSPDQWKALTGASGLGLDDLTTDAQHSLFMAQFPGGGLSVEPETSPLAVQTNRHDGMRDLSTDLPLARLRLRQEVRLMLPNAHRPNSSFIVSEPEMPGKTRYRMTQRFEPSDTLHGVPLHREVPNAPKESQLDYEQKALKKTITLDGTGNVGDLIARIGAVCGLELHADRRYEGRTVTLTGVRTATARRLLQGLAFCLTGTFRRVGPAYVLTDDVLGLGTRQKRLSEFERAADLLQRGPLEAAGNTLSAAHSPDSLPTDADPLALSPAQVGAARHAGWTGAELTLRLPFSALTPGQQQGARQELDWYRGSRDSYRQSDPEDRPTLDSPISVQSSPKLELLLPSLAEPILLGGGGSLSELFRGSPGPPMTVEPRAAGFRPAPLLAGLLKTIPRRAVLARPRTPADVDALVASMKTVGLNELWLDVFSEGVCRVPVTGSAAMPGVTPLPPGAGDVLAEAVRVTRGSGIRVFPALDLLVWGAKVPAAMQDRTVLGETAQEADARPQALVGSAKPPRLAVSPFASPVVAALRSLVRSLAARPELAGIVWRETAPPGYEREGDGQARVEFGYTEAARLLFLRGAHMDPLDVPLQDGSQVNTRLPEFEGGADGAALARQWDEFRSGSDVAFLRDLAATWAGGGARRPILVRQRREGWFDDWFGSWDGPGRPLPAHHSPWMQRPAGLAYPEATDMQAKMTSQSALRRLSGWAALSQGSLLADLTQWVKGKRWDGFVLDLTPDARMGNPPSVPGENPLAGLTPKAK